MQNLHSGQNRNDYSLVASDAVATAATQQPVETTPPVSQPVGSNRIEPPSNRDFAAFCASHCAARAYNIAMACFRQIGRG
jgi:hypothetical protein